jgi:hypothetical protein
MKRGLPRGKLKACTRTHNANEAQGKHFRTLTLAVCATRPHSAIFSSPTENIVCLLCSPCRPWEQGELRQLGPPHLQNDAMHQRVHTPIATRTPKTSSIVQASERSRAPGVRPAAREARLLVRNSLSASASLPRAKPLPLKIVRLGSCTSGEVRVAPCTSRTHFAPSTG